jgi:hypothetical protein
MVERARPKRMVHILQWNLYRSVELIFRGSYLLSCRRQSAGSGWAST